MIAVSASASFILTTAARSATPCAGAFGVPVDRDHLAAQPLERQGQLSAQLAGAEQHHRASFVALLGRLAVGRFVGRRVLGIGGLGAFHSSPVKTARSSAEPDVDVAPSPVLARLHRAHDGVTGAAEVFAGVLVRAGVAAADVAARQAHPQMRPRVLAQLGAVLALPGRQRLAVRRDCGREMRAGLRSSRCVRIAPA